MGLLARTHAQYTLEYTIHKFALFWTVERVRERERKSYLIDIQHLGRTAN